MNQLKRLTYVRFVGTNTSTTFSYLVVTSVIVISVRTNSLLLVNSNNTFLPIPQLVAETLCVSTTTSSALINATDAVNNVISLKEIGLKKRMSST